MRLPALTIGFGLTLASWLLAGVILGGAAVGGVSSAQAQASLIPPAGQPRITAPGGLRGRAARRHKRHRHHR